MVPGRDGFCSPAVVVFPSTEDAEVAVGCIPFCGLGATAGPSQETAPALIVLLAGGAWVEIHN